MDEKLSPKAEAQQRAHAMFEQAQIPVAMFSLDGLFLNCNGALCSLFGYSEAEMRTMDLFQLVHPDDRPEAKRLTLFPDPPLGSMRPPRRA